MKKLIEWQSGWRKIASIAIFIVLGAIFGIVCPEQQWIGIFGDIFIGALKALAPVLVFLLVSSALANQTSSSRKKFRTIIILYLVTTLLAAVVAVAASYIFPVKITLASQAENTPPANLTEVFRTLLINMVSNPVASISSGNYIGILFWAVVLGIILKGIAHDSTRELMSDLSEAVSNAIQYVIVFAPIGIFGVVYSSVSSNGLAIFTDYGKLLLLLVGCMLVTSLIVNPILASLILKRNAYPLVFRCLRESGIYAFFTRSSAANIPVNMQLCEKLGLSKDFYSVSIPLGSTINMDGAAVTIAILSLSLCHTLGIVVHPVQALILCVVSTLGACGASGVPGGSLLLIPMACALFGIENDVAMQAVAVGFIIGVIQDSVETALNSSGDAIFTAVAEYHDRAKRGEPMNFLGDFAKK